MRHRKSGRSLNRSSPHRRSMFRNMAVSLIEHGVIKTTLPKAKELRRFVEPLITLAKKDSVANRRLAFARLRSDAAVGELFENLGPRYEPRPGGYTRIIKAGFRVGDAAPVAYIGLVEDAFEAKPVKEDAPKKAKPVKKNAPEEAEPVKEGDAPQAAEGVDEDADSEKSASAA